MKIAKVAHKALNGEKHWNLILEDLNDLNKYVELSRSKFSRESIRLWIDKENYQDPHVANTSAKKIGSIILSSVKDGEELSVSEYCSKIDQVYISKIENMFKYLNKGDKIRINAKGGYSDLSEDFFTIQEKFIPNDKQINNFILGKEFIHKYEIDLNHNTLVFENESYLSEDLTSYLKSFKDVHVICNFKEVLKGYKSEDLIKLFSESITNIENFVVETTLLDYEQFKHMENLIVPLCEKYAHTVNLHIINHSGSEINVDSEYVNVIEIEINS